MEVQGEGFARVGAGSDRQCAAVPDCSVSGRGVLGLRGIAYVPAPYSRISAVGAGVLGSRCAADALRVGGLSGRHASDSPSSWLQVTTVIEASIMSMLTSGIALWVYQGSVPGQLETLSALISDELGAQGARVFRGKTIVQRGTANGTSVGLVMTRP